MNPVAFIILGAMAAGAMVGSVVAIANAWGRALDSINHADE